jgi:glycosyltransferase involved in cell wall biosynthesis
MQLGGDIVFATSTPLTIAVPGVTASRILRVPMVFEVRDLWPEMPIAVGALRGRTAIRAAQMLERFAYSNSTRIVALSPGMRDGVTRTGYPTERVTVIPNSADIDAFRAGPDAAEAFRKGLTWLGDRKLVIYAGTLGRINGVSYLAEVAARMLTLDPEVRFLVVGGGAEESLVRETAARLGAADRNFFMMPALPKTMMPTLFAAADVVCSLFVDSPQMWSNSANKFFDALAASKPVAINYGGWQSELLRRTSAGIVLSARDYQRAAVSLVTLLRSPASLERACVASGRLAIDEFSRDRLAGELEKTLKLAREDYGRARHGP